MRELLRGWFSGPEGVQTDSPGSSLSAAPAISEADIWCLEGAERLAGGRLAEAEHAVARALECRHDHVEALLLQGAVFREQLRFEEAADSFVLAMHFRPDLAEGHYQLGVIATAEGRIREAESCFRRTLERAPAHAKAHNALGALLSERGAVDEAVSCFRRAIAANPEFAPAHSNLGCLLITRLDEFDEGAKHIEVACRLAPGAPDVKCNWAMLLQYRGQFNDALVRWTELIDSGALADDAKARLDRAMILLLLGDFRAGWDEYEKRFDADRGAARDFGLPRWQGEPLADKTILVYAEQGIGDEIMFASCLFDLIAVAGRVIIECSDRLQALFRRAFPQAFVHGGRKDDPADWLTQCGPVDYQVPVGSLPRRFRPDRAAFPGVYPYLRADALRIEDWRARLRREGAGPVIGISWRGGTAGTRGRIRSVPPELLVKALRPGFSWVSLQHGAADGQPPVPGLQTFPGVTSDLDELAALMSALDLVVSVDNTNVHLAGALGRPVWTLLSGSPEWRYGASGDSMPWYPSAKLYRRNQGEGWEGVLARLALELDVFFG
ncbi:MAG: tetratricopeptide repeat protein [Betaproteobacteria bacterium]|nr:tetratricopeptide repeat protein [Betaproteobacteria bacterium]